MDTGFLRQEQMELEVGAVTQGVNKYYNDLSDTPPANRSPELQYIHRGMVPLMENIEDLKIRLARGERFSQVVKWGVPLLSLPDNKLALITLTSIYNLSESTFPRIAKDISERVLMEIMYEEIKNKKPGVVSWIDRSSDMGMRYEVRSKIKKYAQAIMSTRWGPEVHQAVGGRLLHSALESVGEIEKCWVQTSTGRKAQGAKVKAEIYEAIQKQHSDLSVMRPSVLPMVCPPNDWENAYVGGYLASQDKFSCISPLIRTGLKNHIDEYTPEMFGLHLDAVNVLQRTPWNVNTFIHDVMQDIDILNLPIGKKLATQPKELPCTDSVDWSDPEQVSEWKMVARDIHEHNRKSMGQRSLHIYLQSTAGKMVGYDQFYFTWQMCFRGRFYPRYCGMDPQGDKINKAYLQFARGEKLGPEGFRALTIHLANCMGFDKETLEDRVRLVMERTDEIRGWIDDPLCNHSWTEEDGAQTLAAAKEWLEALDSGNPEEYVSYLPIGIDGKCNGLQHLSALGRDEEGAVATCLEPMDEPQDIYSLVWDRVDEALRETIVQSNLDQIKAEIPIKPKPGEQLQLSEEERLERKRQADFCASLAWRGKTSRKLVKRGAMTWGYGVTKQGIMSQLISDGFLDDVEGSLANNASYMRDEIYDAVNETVIMARRIMEWLQEVAGIAYDHGKCIKWTNPAGMEIQQEYLKNKQKEIRVATGRYRIYVHDMEKREMVRQRQINGIAPNFVHAIDSAHMAMVILRLEEEGIESMRMTHDEYSVHARHVPLLHKIVREEFVKIHSRNLLQEFKDEVEEQLGLELPDYPKQGTFDINRVLDSTYAFT